MSTEGKIRTETHDRIFKIIIDNPAKKNAFSPVMMEQLSDALTELHNNDSYWVGVISAEGKDFTAGLDMPKFFGPTAEKRNFKEGNVDVFGLQKRCRKPVVTAVQGIVFTIGIELMLAADVVIAASDCRFSQLEVKRGIMATGGATLRMAERAGLGNALLHLLTGDEFGAAEALRLNFVQKVVPAGTELEEAIRIAETLAAQAPLAVVATRLNALKAVERGPLEAMAEFVAVQQRLARSEDAAEGVRSFVERRPARFTGR